MSTLNLMVSGVSETITGAFKFTKGKIQDVRQSIGHIQDVGKSIVSGLYGMSLRSGIDGNSELLKYSLTAMAGTIGGLGAIQLANGIQQRNVYKIIQGAATTVTGAVGSVLVYSIDSRMIIAAHHASILGATSSFIGILGFKDLVKGHYGSGLCKMVLGIAGVASAIFYVYNAFPATTLLTQEPEKKIPTKEEDVFPFLESHKKEIEKIYKNPLNIVGKWEKLGNGISKTAFTHEECPGWVFKVPHFQHLTSITIDHNNLEVFRATASNFDRISLPKSHLYPIENGAILVQEMFNLSKYQGNLDQLEAKKQFDDFVYATGLCDMNPYEPHNAGILTGSTPNKMGIIDFDCVDHDLALERQWRRSLGDPREPS